MWGAERQVVGVLSGRLLMVRYSGMLRLGDYRMVGCQGPMTFPSSRPGSALGRRRSRPLTRRWLTSGWQPVVPSLRGRASDTPPGRGRGALHGMGSAKA
jgi:hypothetical protein